MGKVLIRYETKNNITEGEATLFTASKEIDKYLDKSNITIAFSELVIKMQEAGIKTEGVLEIRVKE